MKFKINPRAEMTSALKKQVIDEIIAKEGGYSNDPADAGGETNFGVTAAVARAAGYNGPMRSMPRSVAFDIYARRYWDALNLDAVEQVSSLVAAELADTGVNMGVDRAAEFFQRSLNALNNGATLWADLKVDRRIGPGTVTAFKAFSAQRGANANKIMLRALNCLQGAFYIELAERRATDEKFLAGWLLNRVQ